MKNAAWESYRVIPPLFYFGLFFPALHNLSHKENLPEDWISFLFCALEWTLSMMQFEGLGQREVVYYGRYSLP